MPPDVAVISQHQNTKLVIHKGLHRKTLSCCKKLTVGHADARCCRARGARHSNGAGEPASRVERARILLGYWKDPSFFAVGQALGLHHQTVQRCVERAVVEGPMAALDDRPRPGREPTITVEAKAWLVSLACRKAKDLGYPHELWTTRLLAGHAREHGPAEGHPCLAHLAQGTVCKILDEEDVKPHKVRYYLERRDPEFSEKMAEVLCVYRNRSVMGRLLSRGLRWCWFPIGELRRSCIRYDRSRRRLVCGQPWIGNLAGLKHVVKAEPEEAAYEHADSEIECDRYPSFFRLRIPRRAHRPTASMAGALEWRVPAEFQSNPDHVIGHSDDRDSAGRAAPPVHRFAPSKVCFSGACIATRKKRLYDSIVPFEPEVRNPTCRTRCANFGFGTLERVSICWNRKRALASLVGRIFCGKPASTFRKMLQSGCLVRTQTYILGAAFVP
jgi:hypothetical protein